MSEATNQPSTITFNPAILVEATTHLNVCLQHAIDKKCSDIQLRINKAPYFHLNGRLQNDVYDVAIRQDIFDGIIYILCSLQSENSKTNMNTYYTGFISALEQQGSINLAADTTWETPYELPKCRMRINIFMEQGGAAMTIRILNDYIKPLEELGFSNDCIERLYKHINRTSGLILITGPTGSGKSTTLAAIINYINMSSEKHIITAEDPIEYKFPTYIVGVDETKQYKSLITQREVQYHTTSFTTAVSDALRQAPHVIMIGEMRKLDTIEAVLGASETGHLVLSTLHTNGGYQTISRIISEYPQDKQHYICKQLSSNLNCILSQRLLPTADGQGRTICFELLENKDAIKAALTLSDASKIPNAMERSNSIIWNDQLVDLLKSNTISQETYDANLMHEQDDRS